MIVVGNGSEGVVFWVVFCKVFYAFFLLALCFKALFRSFQKLAFFLALFRIFYESGVFLFSVFFEYQICFYENISTGELYLGINLGIF